MSGVSDNDEAGILPAEAEGIGHGGMNAGFARRIAHDVHAATRFRGFKIEIRRKDPGLQGLDAGDEFGESARAHHVARRSLGRADRRGTVSRAEDLLYGIGFGCVTEPGGRAMGVDIADVRGREPRALQGEPHALRRSDSVRVGRGHVIGVLGVRVAREFCVNFSTARFRVLLGLEDNGAAALADDALAEHADERIEPWPGRGSL